MILDCLYYNMTLKPKMEADWFFAVYSQSEPYKIQYWF